MVRIMACDRCGFREEDSDANLWRSTTGLADPEVRDCDIEYHDLCPLCVTSFNKWWEDKA